MISHADTRKLSKDDRTRIIKAVLCDEHGVVTDAGEIFLRVLEAPTTERTTEQPVATSLDELIAMNSRKSFRDGQNNVIQQIRQNAERKIGDRKDARDSNE